VRAAGIRRFLIDEDAPTEITAATPTKGADGRPNTCAVEGVVWPNVRFRVEFPLSGWNGKMLVVGTGGQAGKITTVAEYESEKVSSRPVLARGMRLSVMIAATAKQGPNGDGITPPRKSTMVPWWTRRGADR